MEQTENNARSYLLKEANAIVNRSRAQQYAPPDRDFKNIADMWSVILGTKVEAGQVAQCMIALKLARLIHSKSHVDSWVDIAGYAACGFEVNCAVNTAEAMNVLSVDEPAPGTIREYDKYGNMKDLR